MSWIATKYAWKCSRLAADGAELVKGTVKLVLLAIAYRVPKGCYETEPTSLGQLKDLTGIQERQLRNCRDALVDMGELEQRGGAGKLATYIMPRLAGPLFVVNGHESSAKIAGFHPAKITGENRQSLHRPAGGVLSSEVPSTEVLTTTGGEAAVALIARAHEFLEWWAAAYPIYNDGAQTTVDLEADGPLVAALLERRDLGRLQAMAVALWKVDAREDGWIADSDRSLRVLRHRADWLDRRLTKVADWWIACPHTPKCSERQQCQAAEAVG